MSYRVEITRRAARDIQALYDWLAERSAATANRWRDRLLVAVNSLEENPGRCPEASEAEWYGPTFRQLIHGNRRQAYRILFEIRGDVVLVFRVRHGAQDFLGPDNL